MIRRLSLLAIVIPALAASGQSGTKPGTLYPLDETGWTPVGKTVSSDNVQAMRLGDGRILYNLTHPFRRQSREAWAQRSGTCADGNCYLRNSPRVSVPVQTRPRPTPTPTTPPPSYDVRPAEFATLRDQVARNTEAIATVRQSAGANSQAIAVIRESARSHSEAITQLTRETQVFNERFDNASHSTETVLTRVNEQAADADQQLASTREEMVDVVRQGARNVLVTTAWAALGAGAGGGGALYLAAAALQYLWNRKRRRGRRSSGPGPASDSPTEEPPQPVPLPPPPEVRYVDRVEKQPRIVRVPETDQLGEAYKEALNREAELQGRNGNPEFTVVTERVHNLAKRIAAGQSTRGGPSRLGFGWSD